eukprot:c23898_g1_i3 orf=376-975(+)
MAAKGRGEDAVLASSDKISIPVNRAVLTDSLATPRHEAAGPLSPIGRLFSQLGPPVTEKERRARERIAADRYDVEAWTIIGNEAQLRPISEAAALYEGLLSTFPTAARYWKAYVESQMIANNDDATKQIFSRCLLNCLHVDLWNGCGIWTCLAGIYIIPEVCPGSNTSGRISTDDCCAQGFSKSNTCTDSFCGAIMEGV